jgi:hypothetical protein
VNPWAVDDQVFKGDSRIEQAGLEASITRRLQTQWRSCIEVKEEMIMRILLGSVVAKLCNALEHQISVDVSVMVRARPTVPIRWCQTWSNSAEEGCECRHNGALSSKKSAILKHHVWRVDRRAPSKHRL